MTKILVVAESQGDVFDRATLSAITMARQASTILGGSFDILVMGGPGSVNAATALACYGAEHILLVEDVGLSVYLAEKFVSTVVEVAQSYALVVAAATSFGRDLLPRVAGCLDAAYAADCCSITAYNGGLSFKRPMYAGNALGFVQLGTQIQVVTARQCEFEVATPVGNASPIQTLHPSAPGRAASRIEIVSQGVGKDEGYNLTEAKTIVSGGRALKDKFFETLAPLADALGAALGATRIACNAGFAPSGLQIGQSGKIVAPQLYFAIGISGAIQHIAGIQNAEMIVAINRDPQAPIFQWADYGLVADLFKAVPEMLQYIRAHQDLPQRISEHNSAHQSMEAT